MDKKKYFTYIMTNANKSVLYIGVTSNLPKRIYEHKRRIVKNNLRENTI